MSALVKNRHVQCKVIRYGSKADIRSAIAMSASPKADMCRAKIHYGPEADINTASRRPF